MIFRLILLLLSILILIHVSMCFKVKHRLKPEKAVNYVSESNNFFAILFSSLTTDADADVVIILHLIRIFYRL